MLGFALQIIDAAISKQVLHGKLAWHEDRYYGVFGLLRIAC